MTIQRKRVAKRLASGLLAGALALGGLAISGGTASAAASVTEDARIAGADRYATANAVATAMAGTRTNITAVVIASGENFPDGLAASALAGAINASNGGSPMFLTPAAALPATTIASILAIKNAPNANAGLVSAVIVGGTSSVSANVEAQLTALGLTVTRIAGADRYETANLVAAAVKANNTGSVIGSFGGYRTAFLANGNNFPDALSASSWAFKNKHPLFLTDGSSLTAGTKTAMTAAGVQQVVILGGTSAVSAEAATEAAGVPGVITTVRVAGDTRYDTATALATTLATVDADYKTRAMLVSGTNFPDALAAAQLAGGTSSYAIIPVTSPLPAGVSTWLTANQATLTNIRAIGGTSAVPADVVTAVKAGATIAKLTATIEALDGAATAKVTFSGAVTSASAQNVGNYTVVSALGVVKTISGSVYTAPTATALGYATLTVTGGLAAGDVVSVIAGNAIVNSTSVGVAPVSATVAADTSAPTATVTAYAGAASATAKVWATFSLNTDLTTVADADFVVTKGSGAIGATPAVVTNCTQVTGTYTFKCDLTAAAALVAGDVVTLKAEAVSTSASTPVKSAAVSAVVAADAVAPTITSVTYSASGTGGAKASVSLPGTVAAGSLKVEVRAAGLAGNAYKVQTDVAAAANACTYTAATKTLLLAVTAATENAEDLVSLCNADADISALFSVTTLTAGALTNFATAAAANLTGGKDLVTYTVKFSEALSAGAHGNLSIDLDGDGVVDTDDGAMSGMITGGVLGQMQLAGEFKVVKQTATLPTSGVATVTATNAFTDLNGNALVTSGTSHIVAAFAAS